MVSRSVGGAAAQAVVGLLARAAGLLTTLVVTHFVSTQECGNANLAMIVTTIIGAATLLSPQQSLLTRHEHFDEAERLVRFFVDWSGVLVAGLLLLFGRAVVTALHQPEATPILWVYCGAMLLERIAVIPALQLNYRLRFADIARLEGYANLSYMLVTIASAAAGAGGLSLAYGMVARHGARVLGLLSMVGPAGVLPAVPRWGALERRLAGESLRYSLPVHLGGTGEFLTLYLDNVLVGWLYGAGAQGLYVVGYTLAMTPCDTIAMQGAVALTRALGVREDEVRRKTYWKGLRYMSALLFPIAALTAVVAGTLQEALLPPRWREVAPIAVALSVGAMSIGVIRLSFAHLTAIQRPRLGAAILVVRLLLFSLCLGAVWLLDPLRRHVPWVGWGVSVAFALSAAFGLVLALRAEGMRVRDGITAVLPPGVAALVAAVLLQGMRVGLRRLGVAPSVWRLAVELGVGVLLYLLGLRLIHPGMFGEMRGWLAAQAGKLRGR